MIGSVITPAHRPVGLVYWVEGPRLLARPHSADWVMPQAPFWYVEGGVLVRTNHNLWQPRVGQLFSPETVRTTFRLQE